MSVNPEADFDLEKLFLPAWAQETPTANRFANYRGDEEARGERPGREGRGPRRDFGGPPRDPQRGPRRDDRSDRGDRGPRGPRPPGGGGSSGPRPAGGAAYGPRPGGQGGPRPDRGERRDFRPAPRPEPEPLPEIAIRITAEEKGADLLARQIKATGRAYPLFDIARLVMQKPERYTVTFTVKKNAEGQILQPLYLCALDDTLWLSENEAVDHVLDKHFATFYQADRTQTEPPKGVYTFVAQCGISGVILGPPNHHDYQNKLRELHETRFSRMPFDMFKSRVRIVRDEEVVKKWVEEQSWRTEYVCLNVPETPRLPDRVEVEKHFRATHLATIVSQVESRTLGGVAARNLRSPELRRLVNTAVEDQRHFPLQLSTSLSQSFASRGLQFFKVNKTITHVCVARPQFLDLENSVVSDRVKRIVEFLNTHPRCKRRALMEALAPAAVAETPAPAVEGATPAAGEAPAPAAPAVPEPTPEQAELSADLHWLIHQGHVVEFSDGHMELARKPLPKPPKAEAKPAAPKAAKPAAEVATPAPAETPSATEAAPESGAAAEVAPSPATEPPVAAATSPAVEPTAAAAQPEPLPAAAEPTPEPPPQA